MSASACITREFYIPSSAIPGKMNCQKRLDACGAITWQPFARLSCASVPASRRSARRSGARAPRHFARRSAATPRAQSRGWQACPSHPAYMYGLGRPRETLTPLTARSAKPIGWMRWASLPPAALCSCLRQGHRPSTRPPPTSGSPPSMCGRAWSVGRDTHTIQYQAARRRDTNQEQLSQHETPRRLRHS